MKLVTTKFKSGGLHEKHVGANFLYTGRIQDTRYKLYTVAQKERIFSNNCNFFIFIIKNYVTPKQPVINAVLITYIDYSITKNYIGKMASFLPYTRPESLLKVLHHIY